MACLFGTFLIGISYTVDIECSTTLIKFINEKGVDYLAIYNSRNLLLHSHE